jgi:hypothetical protein
MGLQVEDCSLELPLHTWIEKGGSKISIKDYFQLPIEFLKVARHYINNREYCHIFPAQNPISLEPTSRTTFI